MKYEGIDDLDTGDVVLFDRNCFKMSPFGGALCAGSKFLGRTEWDHIGIVIKDEHSGQLNLLEATLSGVKVGFVSRGSAGLLLLNFSIFLFGRCAL